jgi:hypothetical protein
MSNQRVEAISSVSGTAQGMDGPGSSQRVESRSQRIEFSSIPPSAVQNGGAYLRTPLVDAQNPALAPMHLGSLDHAIRDGFRQGFVIPQTEKLMAKVNAMRKPGAQVDQGALLVDTMILSARNSLATAFAKAATKLAESLNSIVTRQS